MDSMQHVATYVCDSDPRRHKTFPFRDGVEIPRQIDVDGLTFSLRSVQYEADRASVLEALDATAARVREWNAKHFGGKAA